MLKKVIITFIALFALCGYSYDDSKNIKIAAGAMHGVYYLVALELCDMVEKHSAISSCEVLPTSGSLNNLSLLLSNKVDFAFSQSDLAHDAHKAQGIFVNQSPYKDLRLILNLFPELYTMITRKDTGISRFSDASGAKIGVNLRGAGAKSGLMKVLKYFKFENEPRVTQVSDSKMSGKLCDKEVDIVVLFTGHPSGIVEEIIEKCEVDFVSIDKFKLNTLVDNESFYEHSVIPAKIYKGISRETSSFATRAILVANSETSREKVNLLTKIIRRNFDEFKAKYPVLEKVNRQEVFNQGIIPLYE